MVYLDYSANAPVREEVLEAFLETERKYEGNPNSVHALGKEAKEEFDRLNAAMLGLLKVDPAQYEIVYTSSGSESNNLAVKGIYGSYHAGLTSRLIASPFEHSSVNACLSYLKEAGADVVLSPVTKEGQLDYGRLKEEMTPETILLSCVLVESETGIVQDGEKLSSFVKAYPSCHLLVDATQAVGRIPVDFSAFEMVSFTPHKYGGICGTGVLLKRKSTVLTPLIHGGHSDSLYRSGTTPLGLIASTVKATELALKEEEENRRKVTLLRKRLLEQLASVPGVVLNSFSSFPYIVNLSAEKVPGARMVELLSQRGVCVSQKSACSVPNTPSKPIMALTHDRKRALSSFRVSLSPRTSEAEVDEFVLALKGVLHDGK